LRTIVEEVRNGGPDHPAAISLYFAEL